MGSNMRFATFVTISLLIAPAVAQAGPCDSLQAFNDLAYVTQLSLRRQAIAQGTGQGLQGQPLSDMISALVASPTSPMATQAQQDAAAAQARYSACLTAAANAPH
jgi:hypothetical protein